MSDPTEHSASTNRRRNYGPTTSSHGVHPAQGPGTRWGRRHPKGVTLIRVLAAIWLVVLGSIFCAFGHWWGACFFVLAGLVGWFAYKLPRSRARAASL